jgi:D-glycero-D-manno-heptose 1,7-bisphosphate phosphatase
MTASSSEAWPAVFLDRDGTLMRDVDYCGDPNNVEVFPQASAALRRLKEAGFKLIVVTNQSGIGRGYFTEADYGKVEAEFNRQIGDGMIDASYYCPDLPGTASIRRKPGPGMIFEAQRDLHLDLRRSFLVGDKASDIGCGRNASVRTILVQTGYGAGETNCGADWMAGDIAEAVDIILDAATTGRHPERTDKTAPA